MPGHPSRILLIPCALLLLQACSRPDLVKPRNVILISLDTLRADHLGLYGYSRATSPHLDSLARESVVFDSAIAQSSTTSASHRALFQSKLASQTTPRGRALATVLEESGYRTAGFTGAGNVSAKIGFGIGFDIYEGDPEGFSRSFPKAEGWLREQGDAPFFLFLHTYDPHLPYDPPAPHSTLFYPDYQGPVSGAKTRDMLRAIRRHRVTREGVKTRAPTLQDRRMIVALYDGGIHYTDHYIGRLVDLLSELGFLEDSLLIILSDHGEEFWDHGSVIHSHTLFQELIRVPLIVRLPAGRRGGTRIRSTVRIMDIAPTILDALGVTADSAFEGISLWPVLTGEARAEHRAAVSEMRKLKSLLEYPWKLIRHSETRRIMLFDLESDAGESRNLRAARPEVVSAMEQRLDRALGGRDQTEVPELDVDIQDEELEEQLRALGYVD